MFSHHIVRRSAPLLVITALLLWLLPLAIVSAEPTAITTQNLAGALEPVDLANLLVGEGVAVSNVTYSGSDLAAGSFTGGTGIVGFEQGIVLSSGDIANVVGPNEDDGVTGVNGTAGDADLDILAGDETYDAALLELDFVPSGDNVFFQFVFASDEYNEFVYAGFNDVFAFYVNGQNCALVGGQPVSIDTINNGNAETGDPTPPSHPELYIDNDLDTTAATLNTEMDGLTRVLTCAAAVNPGVANHLKLAIADAGDDVLDSAVFIEAGSLSTEPPTISLTPPTGQLCIGAQHTVTATVTDSSGNPVVGVAVTFDFVAGPHAGSTAQAPTQANGQAVLSYTGINVGTDTIRASFVDPQGNTINSTPVTVEWLATGECATAVTLASFTSAEQPARGGAFALAAVGVALSAALAVVARRR